MKHSLPSLFALAPMVTAGLAATVLAGTSSAATAPCATSFGEPIVAATAGLGVHRAAVDGWVETLSAGDAPVAGEVGGPGLAIRAGKILTCAVQGDMVVDNGVLLVRDGKIEAVGSERDVQIPVGYERLDVGHRWLMPGMIDLHSHIAGSFDINDGVYLTNPGLRAYTSVEPDNPMLELAVGGGVTSILYIPGSGTNISGHGVLLKTGFDRYEEMEIRNPGSLKLAQSGNPERWVSRPNRTFMNWNTRGTFRRGLAYAAAWQAFEDGKGPEPERNINFDIFRALAKGETQVSTHTQIYQVVNETLTMVKEEFGLDVYIDHGTFDGYRAAERAQALGVSAILGPRSVEVPVRGHINWAGGNSDGKFQGVVAGYQERGHKMIGFNTDAPVIPEEEFSIQAAVAARYGFKDTELDTVRGLTIVPAMTAGIDDRVGSLEVGKDADILLLTGHPADPRSGIDTVWIEGRAVYDTHTEPRRW